MMKKLILTLGIVLVLVNVAILFLDDDGRVGRTNFIHKWEQVTAQDVKETLSVPSVLTSANEVPVYLESESGSVSEMLVKPGETVEEGADLFTYQVADYAKTYRELTATITLLDEQVLAVEQAISEAGESDFADAAFSEDVNVPETIDESENEEDTDAATEALQQATEEQTTQLQEQYRISLEKELAEKNAELTAAEEQLAGLEETGEYVTVSSPAAGTVKSIDEAGNKPVITLQSSELVITGELTEAERKQVQNAMTIEAKLEDGPALEGEITELAEQPATSADKESMYKFEASYLAEDEQADKLLAGYHLDTDILLAYASQAPAVKPAQVKNNQVWKMANGQLFTTKVDIGAQNDKQVAITSGLEAGAFIPANQDDYYQNEPFVTPWKAHQMNWSTWNDSFTSYEFLLGLLDH
ncbi:efflux RND transporter periplasmic adaptor subunit [Terribacillus saccharophilus]|uniref:efflux RND transporter periplasmic adaptor subunit n=1 Tax=Terribacillus saccharophilus TaxID=361277 RepID=UPI002DC37C09|nr:efflux RND transporter periplasmic adaptor subunit [Terribacillus saccharophilus]